MLFAIGLILSIVVVNNLINNMVYISMLLNKTMAMINEFTWGKQPLIIVMADSGGQLLIF
ncbi:hypothetical protein BIY28_12755 [Brenneria goodwinii]|nr:hypothetical protein BIY28_12755 [Brenneria goodwinii]